MQIFAGSVTSLKFALTMTDRTEINYCTKLQQKLTINLRKQLSRSQIKVI